MNRVTASLATNARSSWRERLRLPEFFAPLPLAAVGLLALNDHVLKSAYGNWITGKLSDVAICFFLPLFVSALLGLAGTATRGTQRVFAGCAIAAAVFVGQEMVPAIAAAFCRVMPLFSEPLGGSGSCVLTRDPSDLACLAMIPVAGAYGLRRLLGTEWSHAVVPSSHEHAQT